MKRSNKLLLAAILVMTALPALANLPWMSVSVREGMLRDTPMPFGKVLASLGYGDRVDILAEQGQWRKVRDQQHGREGWMHANSLIDKKISLRPGERVDAAASQDELALGGKGFNADVEAAYRNKQNGLNYAAVDQMEQRTVPTADLVRFLKEGELTTPNGEGRP